MARARGVIQIGTLRQYIFQAIFTTSEIVGVWEFTNMSGYTWLMAIIILTDYACYGMECISHKFGDKKVVVTQGDQLFCTLCTRKLKLIIDGQ